MSIAGFYKKTVNTSRQQDIGGSSKRQRWVTNLSSISCAIHPENPELIAVQGSAFYNTFKMFCAKTHDIEIGDRVIDGSDNYTVTGKSLYDDLGGRNNEHMRLTVVKGK